MSERFPSPPYPQDLAERLERYIVDGFAWARHPELIEYVFYNAGLNISEPECSITYTTPDNPEVRSWPALPEEAADAAHAMAIAKVLSHMRITYI